MSTFQRPMQPFPGLERWSREVMIPQTGLKMHIYDMGEEGEMPVVLLLHGLGDEADTWRHVLPLIQPGCRAIALDLPGFGRSDKPEGKYTIPFFEECVLGLMDHLSISRVILVGHSNGAVIAHAFALDHPERVERLVLVSGSMAAKTNRIDLALLLFMIPGVGEWIYNRLRKDPEAAYRTLEPYYNRMEDLPQTDRDFLYQRVNERVWSDGQRRGFFSTLRNLASWIPAQQKGLPSRMQEWHIPTTIVWGENDRVNSIENARALAEMLPSSRLVIVPGAGHNVQQEKPEIVAEATGIPQR